MLAKPTTDAPVVFKTEASDPIPLLKPRFFQREIITIAILNFHSYSTVKDLFRYTLKSLKYLTLKPLKHLYSEFHTFQDLSTLNTSGLPSTSTPPRSKWRDQGVIPEARHRGQVPLVNQLDPRGCQALELCWGNFWMDHSGGKCVDWWWEIVEGNVW